MGLLCLASLGIGIADGCMLRYMGHASERMMDNTFEAILGILFGFSFLALFAFFVGGSIYLCVQFYKRKFTDQGYLTFTLPVRSWQIYVTSLLNFLVWSFILMVSLIAAFILVFVIGFVGTEAWEQIVRSFPAQEIEEAFSGMDFVNPMFSIVSVLSSVMITMNCIILGSVLAKKHKVLAAVGAYYVTNLLMGMVSAWFTDLVYISEPMAAIERLQTVNMVTAGIAAVVGAILGIWLMDKKLNLP